MKYHLEKDCVFTYTYSIQLMLFQEDMGSKSIVDTDSKKCSGLLQDMSDELHLPSSWTLNNLKYLP